MNLRAEDCQDESSPRQVAVDWARNLRVDSSVSGSVARRAWASTLGASEDCDYDESTDKEKIENDEDHAEHIRAGTLDGELQSHCDERVEDCSCKNTFDGTIGPRCTTCEADDLAETNGEEDEGGEGGEELEEAKEAIEHGGFGCDSPTVIVRRPGIVGAWMHCVS